MSWFGNLIGGLLPLVLLGGVYSVLLRRRWQGRALGDRLAQRFMEPRGPDDAPVEKSVIARLGGPNLSFSQGVVARAGTDRPAQRTFDVHVLRPTPGVRAVVPISTGTLLYMLWAEPGAYLPAEGPVLWLVIGAAAYCTLYLLTYELRYDRDMIMARGWAFNRRDLRWDRLTGLRDNGQYLYLLKFSDGSRLAVQKYLVGMSDFLTFAQTQIERNATGRCQNYPKSTRSVAASPPSSKGSGSPGRM